jgi:hypothetical protein
MIYSVKRKGAYSGRKIQNAIAHYKKLLARKEIEGETLWIKNAMSVVLAKFKKYAINVAKI